MASIDVAATLWHRRRMTTMAPIYKILPVSLWREADETGFLAGSPVDLADGFIHFSTGAQVRETARRHFAGQNDLLLVAIDPEGLGSDLRWEPSRGGDLFPHLYRPLPIAAAVSVRPLPLGSSGLHEFPDDVA